jgi:hypothetical protein
MMTPWERELLTSVRSIAWSAGIIALCSAAMVAALAIFVLIVK